MFADNNSIIVVDDRQDDIDRISSVFNKHGIGCRTFQTDGFNYPEKPLKGVKIAFLDINYTNTGDEKAIFGNLLSVIQHFIDKDNGPFVIVFWTTKTEYIERFCEYVNRDVHYTDLPNPMTILPLDKNNFTDENLPSEVDKIYSDPLVKCLFSFYDELIRASDECMYEFTHRLKQPDETWGTSHLFNKRVKDLFSKIAIETLGIENGRKYPDRAIKETLAPIFLHTLLNNGSKVWDNFLEIGDKDKDYFKEIDISDVAPYLNSYIHIETHNIENDARGSVRFIKDENDCFKNMIGLSKEEWVLNNLLNKKKTKIDGEYFIIALEFSAACDYAQGKTRLHKYIMGICLLAENLRTLKPKNIGDNIFSLGFSFIYVDKTVSLLLDFNSVITEEDKNIFGILGDAEFQLKNEIMNVIASKYADHITRIGFNKF